GQGAGPPRRPAQRRPGHRGLAAAVDHRGGEGHRLIADAAGSGQAQPAAHRAASARHRARSAALDELTPGTWRAYRASDSASIIPVIASSVLIAVPAARWSQMKLDR